MADPAKPGEPPKNRSLLGLAVSIATAAVTGGTTAVAVIGMASKVYTLVKESYEFAKDISKVETNIVSVAGALAQRYGSPTIQKMDWKRGAKEIAAAAAAAGFDRGPGEG